MFEPLETNQTVRDSLRAAVRVGDVTFAPACPHCGGRDGVKVNGAAYTACPECQCRFLIDEWAPEGHAFQPDLDPKTTPRRAAWLSDLLGYRPRAVLDAGCGRGEFLSEWPFMTRRDGTESDPDAAHEALAAGCRVFHGEFEEAHIEGRYDLVTCWDLLARRPRPDRLLRSLVDRVDSGGLLALSLPCFEGARVRHMERKGIAWDHGRADFLYSAAALRDRMDHFGFEPVGEEWFLDSGHPMMRRVVNRTNLRRVPLGDRYDVAFRRLL